MNFGRRFRELWAQIPILRLADVPEVSLNYMAGSTNKPLTRRR
jgi:hypothetical protein